MLFCQDYFMFCFFFSSRRRHTRYWRDWSSDVCSSDLNRNSIREFVTIHRGTDDRWETRIGSGNLLMAYVHIAHDVIVGDGCILANNVTLAGHVVVDSYAIIGGLDRKSTRLNSSHANISYAVFCLKKQEQLD